MKTQDPIHKRHGLPFAVCTALLWTFMVSACAVTDARNDVASLSVPGQAAPRLQNLGIMNSPLPRNPPGPSCSSTRG